MRAQNGPLLCVTTLFPLCTQCLICTPCSAADILSILTFLLCIILLGDALQIAGDLPADMSYPGAESGAPAGVH